MLKILIDAFQKQHETSYTVAVKKILVRMKRIEQLEIQRVMI